MQKYLITEFLTFKEPQTQAYSQYRLKGKNNAPITLIVVIQESRNKQKVIQHEMCYNQ